MAHVRIGNLMIDTRHPLWQAADRIGRARQFSELVDTTNARHAAGDDVSHPLLRMKPPTTKG